MKQAHVLSDDNGPEHPDTIRCKTNNTLRNSVTRNNFFISPAMTKNSEMSLVQFIAPEEEKADEQVHLLIYDYNNKNQPPEPDS